MNTPLNFAVVGGIEEFGEFFFVRPSWSRSTLKCELIWIWQTE